MYDIHQTLCFNDSGKSLAFCTHSCAIRLSFFVPVGSIEFQEEKGTFTKKPLQLPRIAFKRTIEHLISSNKHMVPLV